MAAHGSPVARGFRGNCSHGTVGGVLGVEDEFAGQEQFAVGMERSDCRRALLRGEGLTDAQPRKGEFHGSHCGAESLGSGAFLLRDGLLGFTLSAACGCVMAGVGVCGCCGHAYLFRRGKLILETGRSLISLVLSGQGGVAVRNIDSATGLVTFFSAVFSGELLLT